MKDTKGHGRTGKITGRMLSGTLAAAAVLLLSFALAFGDQDQNSGTAKRKWMGGLTVGMAIPSGAFMDNIGHPGFNLDLYAGRRLGNSHFILGLDCYLAVYGLKSRDEYLSTGIPVQVDVSTSNNILQGLLFLKFQPWAGRTRPYVEALAGFSYLYTETSISGNEYPYDEITSDTNFDDGTYCVGLGVGMDINLGKGPWNAGAIRGNEYRLDIKVRYLRGGRAQYLREDSIVYENGGFTYLYRESTTNLISVQVGLLINF
jgi:hypothetical protein